MAKKENGNKCVICNKPLTGRATKFCGDNHRVKFYREQKKEQVKDVKDGAIIEVDKYRREAEQARAVVTYHETRASDFQEQLETTRTDYIEAEKKAASALGKLSVTRIVAIVLFVNLIIALVVLVIIGLSI